MIEELPQIILNDENHSVTSFDAYSLFTYHSNDHLQNDDESVKSSRSNSIVTFDS